MRTAIKPLQKYIASARVAKYRLFVYIPSSTIPDGQVVVIAREDDYFLGMLHSRPHEIWSLQLGTSLEDRPRYSQSLTFETFPFPWAPGREPQDDPRLAAIAAAAKELVEMRERWLAPAPSGPAFGGPPPPNPKSGDLGEAARGSEPKRTLTNLYNARPTWLELAHQRLDAAVFAAYGWPSTLGDEEILERLLALNLKRSEWRNYK
jgi:hypothetical protein